MKGDVYGEWTVVNDTVHRDDGGNAYLMVRCSCGETRLVNRYRLENGYSSSCGHGKLRDRYKAFRHYEDEKGKRKGNYVTAVDDILNSILSKE